MPRPHFIQIDIPDPCNQRWEEMTPCAQGRFCGHCQKTVIDFTTWSDAALYTFFSRSTGDVCGRFLTSQTDRQIYIPPQPHSALYRIVVALGLTIVSLHGTDAYAQQCKPPMEHKLATYRRLPKDSAAYYHEMTGVVLDEKKQPIIGAVVQVYQNGIAKGGAVTDFDGIYIIRPMDKGLYEIQIAYVGYEKYIEKDIEIAEGVKTALNITMRQITNPLQQVKMGGMRKPLVPRYPKQNIVQQDIKPAEATREDYQRGAVQGPKYIVVPNIPEKKTMETDEPGKHTFKKDDIRNMPIR